MRICTKVLPILERLPPDFAADICLVTVRREQIETVLPDLAGATAIPRVVFLMNHAKVSENLLAFPEPSRRALAFPGIAGYRETLIIRYLDIPQQHTVVEESALDVISLFREAGFAVDAVQDMDAWLQRHAVFITAMGGALYENDCDALRLAQNLEGIRRFVVAVREGWTAQGSKGVRPAPFALRAILCWVPLRFSARYWSRLLASHGKIYFARHTRYAPRRWLRSQTTCKTSSAKGKHPDSRDCWPRSTPGT